MKELENRKVSNYIRRIIGSYLRDRVLKISEKEMKITMGVPQGSVLGPLLWNIFYDEVMQTKMPDGIQIIGYADDSAIIVEAKTETEIELKTEEALTRVITEIEKRGLELAIENTEVLILVGGNKFKEITLNINGSQIKSEETIKYLGVMFSRNNNMKSHLKHVITKADKTVNALSKLMPNIGGSRATKRRTLGSVVHSIVLYAAPVWRIALSKKYNRVMMEGMQRRIAARICSAYRTISTDAALAIADIMPIDLMVLERERLYQNPEESTNIKEEVMQAWVNR